MKIEIVINTEQRGPSVECIDLAHGNVRWCKLEKPEANSRTEGDL